MATITCKVPDRLNAQIEAEAREQRVPKSKLIRETLEKRFNGKRRTSPPTFYERTKHLCGSVRGGPSDLATNPKHMEGFGA